MVLFSPSERYSGVHSFRMIIRRRPYSRSQTLPQRVPEFYPGKTLRSLLKEGNLGKKTGKGVYEWVDNAPIRNTKEKANLYNLEHYFAIQLNEGCRLLEEKIVSGYKVIDEAMLAGMDMPGPFSTGKKNYSKWSKMLEELAEESGIDYLKPCNLMKSGGFLDMRK